MSSIYKQMNTIDDNESLNIDSNYNEFYSLCDILSAASNNCGGDFDDAKGDVGPTSMRIIFTSYTDKSNSKSYEKSISKVIEDAMLKTRFNDGIRVYVTNIPERNFSTYMPQELIDKLKSKVSIFEVEVTAKDTDDSLSLLTESKIDRQNLVDFAGADITDEFFKIKDKLKSPENDLYYWINNKTVEDLAEFIKKFNSSKSNTSLKKEASDGAKLVATTPHYSIYEILSLEASQKYGRDTTWCISGIEDGREFWRTLNAAHVYFLINKHAPARSWESKFAIVVYKDNDCEIRDVNDNAMFFDEIPYADEIHIPDIDVSKLPVIFVTCAICEEPIQQTDDYDIDDYGAHYCSKCIDINNDM